MAADLDRAGQDPGGLLQAGPGSFRPGGSSCRAVRDSSGVLGFIAGPDGYYCITGESFIVFRYILYVFQ